jgi:hypothetical protein
MSRQNCAVSCAGAPSPCTSSGRTAKIDELYGCRADPAYGIDHEIATLGGIWRLVITEWAVPAVARGRPSFDCSAQTRPYSYFSASGRVSPEGSRP